MNFIDMEHRHVKGCAALYTAVFTASPWNEPLDDALSIARLRFLLSIPSAKGKQCIIKNQIVGLWIGFIEPVSNFTEFAVKEVAVHPDFQRKGIGKQLMLSLEAYALEKKCKQIVLSTARNSWLYHYYQKLGYNDLSVIGFMKKPLQSK